FPQAQDVELGCQHPEQGGGWGGERQDDPHLGPVGAREAAHLPEDDAVPCRGAGDVGQERDDPATHGVDGHADEDDARNIAVPARSEEHTSELQSRFDLVCRLLLEKKKKRQQVYELPTKHAHTLTTTRYTM